MPWRPQRDEPGVAPRLVCLQPYREYRRQERRDGGAFDTRAEPRVHSWKSLCHNPLMAYIICEPCIGTKDTACVDVCPVDCIHPRKDEAGFADAEMLYIHPDECIDCGACVPACPVEAIFALDETPHKWSAFIEKNRAYYG